MLQVHLEVLVLLQGLPVAFILFLHKVDFTVSELHILLGLLPEGQLLDTLGGEVLVQEYLLAVLELQSDVAQVFDNILYHVDTLLEFGLFQLVEVRTELSFEEIKAIVDRDAEILLLCDLELGGRRHDDVPLFVGGGAVPDEDIDSANEALNQSFKILFDLLIHII